MQGIFLLLSITFPIACNVIWNVTAMAIRLLYICVLNKYVKRNLEKSRFLLLYIFTLLKENSISKLLKKCDILSIFLKSVTFILYNIVRKNIFSKVRFYIMAKIVVVGANHAGTAAIKTMLTNYGQENEIVVFDQNSNISFLGCGMALWIGEQIGGPEGLFYSNKEELESLGATVYMESPVTNIDYDAKTVTALVNGQEHVESFEKLLFATGSQPILPPIKGAEIKEGSLEFEATLENLQFVKLYQNSADVIEKLKNKDINRVAVVGAGYIGVELAEAFQRKGKEVILIDVVDTCLAGYYDRDLSDLMAKTWKSMVFNLPLAKLLKKLLVMVKLRKSSLTRTNTMLTWLSWLLVSVQTLHLQVKESSASVMVPSL